MTFINCSIIITVLNETDLFEEEVQLLFDTCKKEDLKELIIAVHPKYTTSESIECIERMGRLAQSKGIGYKIVNQKLPGMGGAMRDALEVAEGSHVIILTGDQSADPSCVALLIEYAKLKPNSIISASRYAKGGRIEEEGYGKLKMAWNKLSQIYCSVLYQSRLSDFTLAYRICPTEYYHGIVWEETKHPFALETTLKFLRVGIPVYEIPCIQKGGTQTSTKEKLSYLPVSIKIRFMRKKKFVKKEYFTTKGYTERRK
jgi:hypothetical protein